MPFLDKQGAQLEQGDLVQHKETTGRILRLLTWTTKGKYAGSNGHIDVDIGKHKRLTVLAEEVTKLT